METVSIDGVILHLSQPDELPMNWVGNMELVTQVKAAWLVMGSGDFPLNPRLIGRPGVGKTTLAYHAARQLNKPVYLFQATIDTRPEDLIVTPVISDQGKIKYMASSIVTAMIKGGVAVIDEGNRMSEKSWASLAPLMDNRRYVESIVAGIKIKAHPDFRLCTTMNDDASTFDLPEYIHSRLQPQIFIDFPDREEERLILSTNLPFADEQILEYVVNFLQVAHEAQERYTVRDGINIARYALKKLSIDISKEGEGMSEERVMRALKKAASMILDDKAAEYFATMLEMYGDKRTI
ncbi:MAG: MoxR family ATPase [Deltaproteobacteria bacterium]|nr:MoxR family ATPase [Deltaproteobacteria bacterium]OQY16310.1 MAG: ATPase [Desulfobacterium sp. 4572_20]RLB24419.1 MAG: MoxR family ATPase [Deltaproteobacteria bacterium]